MLYNYVLFVVIFVSSSVQIIASAADYYNLAAQLAFLASLSPATKKQVLPGEEIGLDAEAINRRIEQLKAEDAERKKKELEKTAATKPTGKPTIIIGAPAKLAIKGYPQIQPTLASVTGMKATLPAEKKAQKAKAREFLEALSNFVESRKNAAFGDQDQAKILTAVKTILDIDPLLISTGVEILKTSKFPQKALYDLMVKLYENRIAFLVKEFGKIKPNVRLYKGVRDDIDEGLGYPIEISSDIQQATIKSEKDADAQAKQFVDEIEKLRQRLLALLRNNQKSLQENDVPVEEYISMIEQKQLRAYCINKQTCDLKYKSFFTDLQDILDAISEYKKQENKMQQSAKIYKKQSIMNKLAGFIAYSSDQSFCQICIDNDIQANRNYDIEGTTNIIENFFKNLPAHEQNAGTRNAAALAKQVKEILQARLAKKTYSFF